MRKDDAEGIFAEVSSTMVETCHRKNVELVDRQRIGPR